MSADPTGNKKPKSVWNRRLNSRPFLIAGLLTCALLLLAINGLLVALVAPFLIYSIIGFKKTPRKTAFRACLSPLLLALPVACALWAHSHQRMHYFLVGVGGNRFVGAYLFPGVVEAGYYYHDAAAGLKFLREGVTEEIADVMTDDVKRFQRFEGSDQVYDCMCFHPLRSMTAFRTIECRYVPVIDGAVSVGSIYAGLFANGWTSSSFYWNSGRWGWGHAYASTHVGLHIAVPCFLLAIPFVRKMHYWRRREYRLRQGLCVECGYNLTGLPEPRCPECGQHV